MTPPSGLTADRWYRRLVSSCGETKSSFVVKITVGAKLGIPTGPSGVTVCGSGTERVTVGLSTEATTAKWYTVATGGTPFRTSTYYDVPAQAATYYVASANADCESAQRKEISVQVADLVTWYLDGDGDDHAIDRQDACSSPGTGWTQTVLPVDDCDDGNASITTAPTWYVDSDGDGYRDPDGEERVQCNAPTNGNWTTNTSIDNCPNHANSMAGSNGCNMDCLPFYVDPTPLEFTSNGGTKTATVVMGCTTGYGIGLDYTSVDWFTVSLVNGNELRIECQPGAESKEATINVRVNGNSGGGLLVKRGGGTPPPSSCTATDIADISFGAFSGSDTVTVSYSGDCTGTVVLRSPIDANGGPDWLTIAKSGLTFTLSVPDNATGITRTTILAPMLKLIFINGTERRECQFGTLRGFGNAILALERMGATFGVISVGNSCVITGTVTFTNLLERTKNGVWSEVTFLATTSKYDGYDNNIYDKCVHSRGSSM